MQARLAFAPLLVLALLAGCAAKEGSPDPTPTASPTTSDTTTATTSAGTTTTSAASSTSATARPSQTFQKDVTDNAFPEGSFTAQKGDTVVWTHRGTNIHTVSTTAGSAQAFDSHPNCPPVCMVAGQTYQRTLDTVGDVTYHCKVHGGMTGTITVVEALPA